MATNQDMNPQNGMQGSSYIYKQGMSPNTRAVSSQKVRILTPAFGNNTAMYQMGVLGSFGVSQSRAAEEIRGIGMGDQIAEVVPGITAMMTAEFERALLYLGNLWQATGYAAGVDGPVRSLAHHKWPFDIEQQVVLSTLADMDLGVPNTGLQGKPGSYNGGVSQIKYPEVTPGQNGPIAKRGHSAIITIYETCWFTGTNSSYTKDGTTISESGSAAITDVHDFASMYGEFMDTGNDPSLGQLGSIRFAGNKGHQAGGDLGGGGTQSAFVA